MLDPRIYRRGLFAVLVAAIVAAFSLTAQQGAAGTSQPSAPFNGQNAYQDMVRLARRFPNLRPGSGGDDRLAGVVTAVLRRDGFSVFTRRGAARTAEGTRTLTTVTASLAGQSGASSIVIVAHRDAADRPSLSDLSGTAVLLELGRVLSNETHQRTIVLASTSGSAGAAGAAQLARSLDVPVDAVIALGDLASSQVRQPVLVPWSDGQLVAPTLLRNTVAAALGSQAGLPPGHEGIWAQLAHLAFPLSATEQAPFGSAGYPAMLVSLSGERPSELGQTADPSRVTALGQTVLETINALDGAPTVPPPSAYLLFGSHVVPGWAIRLLVLALIFTVMLTMADGLARARRHGHAIARWLLWVLLGSVPFVLAFVLVLAARLGGLLGATPPGPLGAGAVSLGAAGIAMIVVVGGVILASLLIRRPVAGALGGHPLGTPANAGAGAAVLLVMCVVALLIWFRNPFTAALLVPALHLWMWVLDPQVRMPRSVAVLLVVAGVAPGGLVVVFYAHALGLSPIQVIWNGVLLVAGGYIGGLAAVQWSVVLGCLASVISIAVSRPRLHRSRPAGTVTVRGPVRYAGPGSLGGTESALRR